MTTKTHITAQQEGVEEVGIQIRDNDPASPADGMPWLNRTQGRLKVKLPTGINVLASYSTIPKTLTDNLIDASGYDTFVRSLGDLDDYTFDIVNLSAGKGFQLLVKNIGTIEQTVYFEQSVILGDGMTAIVEAGKSTMFNIFKDADKFYVYTTQFP